MTHRFGDVARHTFHHEVMLMYLGRGDTEGRCWFLVLKDEDPMDAWPVGRVVDGIVSSLHNFTWLTEDPLVP